MCNVGCCLLLPQFDMPLLHTAAAAIIISQIAAAGTKAELAAYKITPPLMQGGLDESRSMQLAFRGVHANAL